VCRDFLNNICNRGSRYNVSLKLWKGANARSFQMQVLSSAGRGQAMRGQRAL
jgi:hypothetical protein